MVLFGGLWSWRHSQSYDYSVAEDGQWQSSCTMAKQQCMCVQWDDLHAPSLTGRLDDHTRETLRMCVIYTVSYLGLAVVAYSFVFEQWSVIDSLYFAVSTFTTVGYGDLEPQSQSSQLFTIFFAVYGVIILGIFIGVVGHGISEGRAATTHRWKRNQKRRLLHSLFPEYRPPSYYPSERDSLLQQRQRRYSWWSDHVSLLEDVWNVVKVEVARNFARHAPGSHSRSAGRLDHDVDILLLHHECLHHWLWRLRTQIKCRQDLLHLLFTTVSGRLWRSTGSHRHSVHYKAQSRVGILAFAPDRDAVRFEKYGCQWRRHGRSRRVSHVSASGIAKGRSGID